MRVIVHNHLTRDAAPSTKAAWAAAKYLDTLKYLEGLKRLALVSDKSKWNAEYGHPADEILLQRKFELKDFFDKLRTLLHEAGHRGQYKVDPGTYAAYKQRGLVQLPFFLAMANAIHQQDFRETGRTDNLDEEIFAESYARFCLGMDMPEPLRVFWAERSSKQPSGMVHS